MATKFSPWEKVKKMTGSYRAVTPLPPSDEEDSSMLAIGLNKDGVWNMCLAAFLLTVGGFIWHVVNPFLFRPDYAEAMAYYARNHEEAGENITEIRKAFDQKMWKAASLLYHDQPKTISEAESK